MSILPAEPTQKGRLLPPAPEGLPCKRRQQGAKPQEERASFKAEQRCWRRLQGNRGDAEFVHAA